MTLIDPREALADQSNFIGYLLGLAGLGQVVHALAAEGDVPADPVRRCRRLRPPPPRPGEYREMPSSGWPNLRCLEVTRRASHRCPFRPTTRWLR